MAKKFLFRVFHKNIIDIQNATRGITWLENWASGGLRQEWHYVDYLCSIPGTVTEVIEITNILAYAEACLKIDSALEFCYVFELSESKGIDHETPSMMLHCIMSGAITNLTTNGSNFWAPFNINPSNHFQAGQNWPFNVDKTNFSTYDLVNSKLQFAESRWKFSPFIVANIVRPAKNGPYERRFHRCVVSWEDYFINRNGRTVLYPKGSLGLIRFPLWRRTMEKMRFGHIGYTVDRSGQLKPRSELSSKRHLMSLVKLDQQKRMFRRRSVVLSRVFQLFMDVVRKCHTWLWLNQIYGAPRPKRLTSSQYADISMVATICPWQSLKQYLREIVDFVNAVAIAGGHTSLIIYWPGSTPNSRLLYYNQASGWLTTGGPVTRPLAVFKNTANGVIMGHIVNLLGSLMYRIKSFEDEELAARDKWQGQTRANTILKMRQYVNGVNNFALAWNDMQKDFYNIVQLLGHWQATYWPDEPTKGTNAATNFKTPKPVLAAKNIRDTLGEEYPAAASFDVFRSRWSWDRPEFKPFRLWDYSLFPDDIAKEEQEEKEREYDLDLTRRLEREKQRMSSTKIEREREREPLLPPLNPEWAGGKPTNPLDPWARENLTSWTWWTTPIAVNDIPEFALNAANPPPPVIAGAAMLPKHEFFPVTRFTKKPPPMPGNEFTGPVHLIYGDFRWQDYERYVTDPGAQGRRNILQLLKANGYEEFAKRVEDHDAQYKPRSFWLQWDTE